LAAIAVAEDENISDQDIVNGLADFSGVGRRFEVYLDQKINDTNFMLIDDYGHHPREVKATLTALWEGWPKKRVVMLFQPHRYTRTEDLYDDFVSVLSQVDCLLILDVYSAGEEPIPGADSRSLCISIRKRGKVDPVYVADISELPDLLAATLQEGDALIMQGAGNIGKICSQLIESKYKSAK